MVGWAIIAHPFLKGFLCLVVYKPFVFQGPPQIPRLGVTGWREVACWQEVVSWQVRDEGRSRGKLGGPLSYGHSSLLYGGSELAGKGSWEVPSVYWEVTKGSRNMFHVILNLTFFDSGW